MLTQHRTRLGHERLFIIGDAAGYIEPFTGEGIGWALNSALALAPIASAAVANWRPEYVAQWTAENRRLLGNRQRSCRLITLRASFSYSHPPINRGAVAPAGLSSAIYCSFESPTRHRLTGTYMSLAILGLGAAIPSASMTQDEAMRIAKVLCCRSPEQMTWLPTMYAQTGIGHRHVSLGQAVVDDLLHGTDHSQSVFLPKDVDDDRGPTTGERMKLYEQLAVPLAVQAAERGLEESGLKAQEITHLITVSCTGFFAPGIDYELIRQLSMRPTVERTHVGFMGCHGAINGLRVASAFAGADANAKVLLCAVELSSLHYQYGWDPQQIVANALFGDGAASVVGVQEVHDGQAWNILRDGLVSIARILRRYVLENWRPWLCHDLIETSA